MKKALIITGKILISVVVLAGVGVFIYLFMPDIIEKIESSSHISTRKRYKIVGGDSFQAFFIQNNECYSLMEESKGNLRLMRLGEDLVDTGISLAKKPSISYGNHPFYISADSLMLGGYYFIEDKMYQLKSEVEHGIVIFIDEQFFYTFGSSSKKSGEWQISKFKRGLRCFAD